jgi:phenylacetate-CoA ligase
VIATPLHNFAMPLIRYEIGDFAEVGQPCICGRGLPVLTRIIGRYRHRIILPDGSSRVTLFGAQELYRIPAIRQYQAVQTARDTIEMHLVMRRPLTTGEDRVLTGLVHANLPEFKVPIVYVEALPRMPSGKFQDFRSEIL